MAGNTGMAHHGQQTYVGFARRTTDLLQREHWQASHNLAIGVTTGAMTPC